ncbi:MAG: aminotransferase class I/II-fold pyridoxal phosphate-dependent enzyme [Clostridia bacterium]
MTPYIYNCVKKTNEKIKARFCMPGHIGKEIGMEFDTALKYDLTELIGTDNLNNPSGVILKSLENAKEISGATSAAFITSGASIGIKAMLFLASRNKKIIVDRFSHHSVIDGIALSKITPIFTKPRYRENTAIPTPPTKSDIKELILKNKDVNSVIITTPNYYGIDADLAGIYEVCQQYGKKLLVDNSHGTHYLFLKNPPYKIAKVCDMWVNSAHKTLPILTGGAILFSNYIKREELTNAISLFSTSSPSFLTLASLDFGLCFCDKNRNKFEKVIENTNRIKEKLTKIGYKVVECSDKLRLVVEMENAEKVLKSLYLKGIAIEMADEHNLVLIISPLIQYNELNLLAKELKLLYNKRSYVTKTPKDFTVVSKMPVNTAMFSESEVMSIDKAIGEISAECVTVYPPSVPIIVPGELLTKEVIGIIKTRAKKSEIRVVKKDNSL